MDLNVKNTIRALITVTVILMQTSVIAATQVDWFRTSNSASHVFLRR